ncbi:XXYS1_4_G0033150.mRNA.1.CDS.1 [Saccharomyces cerevisiae]|nr:XXYS1_4_G0033150.mRNA.1.CDS.1 [Saccharomyces cerevisiae]CAD6645015.1 EM14S01-3B_G0016660.mRNA.1.CDS.1 [Saccharomyces cerevisiae]
MLQACNTFDSLHSGMFVTVQSVAILDGKSGNKTVSEVQFPVLFDSGATTSASSIEIADSIGKSLMENIANCIGEYTQFCDSNEESLRFKDSLIRLLAPTEIRLRHRHIHCLQFEKPRTFSCPSQLLR